MIDKNTNWMEYQENMEVIPHDIMDQVIEAKNNFDPDKYTALDVKRALDKDSLSPEDFAALLSPAAFPFLILFCSENPVPRIAKTRTDIGLFI